MVIAFEMLIHMSVFLKQRSFIFIIKCETFICLWFSTSSSWRISILSVKKIEIIVSRYTGPIERFSYQSSRNINTGPHFEIGAFILTLQDLMCFIRGSGRSFFRIQHRPRVCFITVQTELNNTEGLQEETFCWGNLFYRSSQLFDSESFISALQQDQK